MQISTKYIFNIDVLAARSCFIEMILTPILLIYKIETVINRDK